ncbi:segregation/condensation protein A, partial [Streptomyces sp. RTd22]
PAPDDAPSEAAAPPPPAPAGSEPAPTAAAATMEAHGATAPAPEARRGEGAARQTGTETPPAADEARGAAPPAPGPRQGEGAAHRPRTEPAPDDGPSARQARLRAEGVGTPPETVHAPSGADGTPTASAPGAEARTAAAAPTPGLWDGGDGARQAGTVPVGEPGDGSSERQARLRAEGVGTLPETGHAPSGAGGEPTASAPGAEARTAAAAPTPGLWDGGDGARQTGTVTAGEPGDESSEARPSTRPAGESEPAHERAGGQDGDDGAVRPGPAAQDHGGPPTEDGEAAGEDEAAVDREGAEEGVAAGDGQAAGDGEAAADGEAGQVGGARDSEAAQDGSAQVGEAPAGGAAGQGGGAQDSAAAQDGGGARDGQAAEDGAQVGEAPAGGAAGQGGGAQDSAAGQDCGGAQDGEAATDGEVAEDQEAADGQEVGQDHEAADGQEVGQDHEAAEDGNGTFTVRLDNFEGPFDLLLQLISKHKLDVTEVALSKVTDEFMAHIRAMGPDWDLDQTTEFLVVAATLLDLKAARLLPAAEVEDEADLALLEARDLLFARLLQYRAYKRIADIFNDRLIEEARRYPRTVGLEPHHADLLPDVVIRVGPEGFAKLAVKAMQAKPKPQVYVDHIHAPLVSVREQAEVVVGRLRELGEASFAALTEDAPDVLTVVARFLALLELYRERAVLLDQPEALGSLLVRWTGGGAEDGQGPLVTDEFDQEAQPQKAQGQGQGQAQAQEVRT